MPQHNGYMDRALRARDPRFARILGKLGYKRRDMVAADPSVDELPVDEMAVLREEYQAAVGKRPFNGWDADTVRAKIADAKG